MKSPIFFFVALAAATESFYSTNKNIYELTPANFHDVVHKTNYTSIVEFYAPWCGYCKQIKPVFSKLGKFINSESKYAINVASVNCDEAINQKLCSDYKIEGFPTIMVFRPPKYQPGKINKAKHVSEVFSGLRDLGSMVEFATSRIKNYVKKIFSIHSEAFINWLDAPDNLQKVIVLTKSNTISPLLRTLAIDFLDSASFAAVDSSDITGPTSISYNGEEIEIPVTENESFPILLVYDRDSNKFIRYTEKSLKKLNQIEKFIMSNTGIVPSEGKLSRKAKRLSKLRGVSIKHDEL